MNRATFFICTTILIFSFQATFSQIPDQENIFIYNYLQVREDAQTLFCFADKLERSLFKKLISVSGIGIGIAIIIFKIFSNRWF